MIAPVWVLTWTTTIGSRPKARLTIAAGGDVDPLPVDPVALHHHVAEVKTDAKLHPSGRGHVRVSNPDGTLDVDGATGRVERAWKLGQEIVPRRIDHPAPMLADQVGGVLAVELKGPHRRDLVFGKEAAVADCVGAQDGGQSVNDSVGVHHAAWRSSEHQR